MLAKVMILKAGRIVPDLMTDAEELARCAYGSRSLSAIARAVITTDSYRITTIQRIRNLSKRLHIPGVNHMLRMVQSGALGIEIGNDVILGSGVYFVHTHGIVIGGDARIGDRVRFCGSNTIGTAKDNGYPIIEDDVVIGAGARILGPITVGARSVIGANAVVLSDVPPDSVATGIPAKNRPKR